MNAVNEVGTKEQCPQPAEGLFFIEDGGAKVLRKPTDGKWYVGMVADESYAANAVNNGFRDEALAQYDAELGAFFEDRDDYGEFREVDMSGYDHLVEQL